MRWAVRDPRLWKTSIVSILKAGFPPGSWDATLLVEYDAGTFSAAPATRRFFVFYIFLKRHLLALCIAAAGARWNDLLRLPKPEYRLLGDDLSHVRASAEVGGRK
jgi:hypothetical protein